MKKRLYLNNKIEVRKSLYGYGVFAKEKIEKDEILEECFYLVQPYTNPYNVNYLYRWPQKGKPIHMVIALGFGSIYNSSKTLDERNAEWITDKENNIFIFKTIKLIEKDEEIFTYYGDNWWKNYNKKYLPENIK